MSLLEIGEAELMAWINGAVWPFVRISALLVAAPLFGARTVPVRVRIALAALLALLIAPGFGSAEYPELYSLAGAIAVLREILVGVTLGFLLQMMFAALAMAGEIVALSTGLAFATMVDPDRGGSVPLVSQHFVILATLLFLAFDGHLALLMLLMRSFEQLPAAGAGMGDFWVVVAWGTEMFRGAVLVALPAAAALLLANVSMGLIARSAPQLNIFAVGFPMTLLLGLVFLLLGMPALAPQLEVLLQSVLGQAATFVGMPGATWQAP